MKNTIQDKNIKRLRGALSTADLTTLKLYKELTKFDVQDKVILITGGSRGLGFALAKLLAQRGAKIALCARSSEQLGQAQVELEQMGAQVATFVADVTKPEQVQELLRDVLRHYYGQLDVLINNAGITRVPPQEILDLHDFEQIMKTNFWASLYTMFAAIPIFQKQGKGRIVNIASNENKTASSNLLPYTASKFALIGVSDEMHTSLKKHNINVTTVVPGQASSGSSANNTHDGQYPWFKMADSSSSMTVSSTTAAQQIVHALEYGLSEVMIEQKSSRTEEGIRAMLPQQINSFLTWANL